MENRSRSHKVSFFLLFCSNSNLYSYLVKCTRSPSPGCLGNACQPQKFLQRLLSVAVAYIKEIVHRPAYGDVRAIRDVFYPIICSNRAHFNGKIENIYQWVSFEVLSISNCRANCRKLLRFVGKYILFSTKARCKTT